MKITADQREAWARRAENREWEQVIGPCYKKADGAPDLDALHDLAALNGLDDTRARYEGLNAGQVAMNVRNRLRRIWQKGNFQINS